MRRVLLSMVAFNNIIEDLNEKVKVSSGFEVDGLELDLLDHREFDLSGGSMEILKRIPEKTLHASNRLDERGREREKTIKLAKELGIKRVVFHVQRIKNFGVIKKEFSDFDVCMETPRPGEGFLLEKMKKVLDDYPEFFIVLDTTHLLENDSLEEHVKTFGSKIAEIHLSSTTEEHRHWPLHKTPAEVLKKLEIVKSLDCPVVIECLFSSFDEVEKEIEFVKKFLRE